MKNRIKRILAFFIIIILLIITGVLFAQKQDCKHTLLYQYQTVPDIELINTLHESQDGIFFGEASGFVKFDNIEYQPIGLRQYYIIKPLTAFNKNASQYFSLEESIKMNYVSLKSLGMSKLIEINKTAQTITLEDEYSNQFFINKNTKEISMRDTTGNTITLITSDSDYKKFMKEWLSKK